MPQIILKGGVKNKGGDNNPETKPDESAVVRQRVAATVFARSLDREQMLYIGAGTFAVLAVAIALFVLTRPNAPAVERVPPPPGFPDVYPYNSKEYQKRGMPAISGVPPVALVKQWNQKK